MKVGFIGGGKMAEAILVSLVETGTVGRDDIIVCEIDAARGADLAARHGLAVSSKPAAVLTAADVVFLAVKPQDLDTALGLLGESAAGKLFISIAAGKRLATLEARLPRSAVVRVMPNIAALAGASANAWCAGARVSPAQRAQVETLLNGFGRALELPEAQFDAVTALSGSGPAFLAVFIEAMIAGGVALGLDPDQAAWLGQQTALGTARLLVDGRFTPETLIAAVSSKKGTTVAGLEVLRASSLAADVARTLEAAARRGRELRA